ncbi:MAG: tetratricopeptide repeat protein [Pseudomonadota bacterium]
MGSSGYSDKFSIITFLTIFFILSSPILIYWAGVWIWGSGYICRAIKYLVHINYYNKFLKVIRIAFAIFIAIIVFWVVGQIVIPITKLLGAIGLSSIGISGKEAANNLDAIANILAVVFGFILARKFYRWIMKSGYEPSSKTRKQKWIRITLYIFIIAAAIPFGLFLSSRINQTKIENDKNNEVLNIYTEAEVLQLSIAELKKAAEQGNPIAQARLGLYYAGSGVSQDYTEAVKWYRKAATQGNITAEVNLAAYYGTREDLAESVKWWTKAAEQGNAMAQATLGWHHYMGLGVPKNYTEAIKWYRKSVEQENQLAQLFLGQSYYWGNGVRRDHTEAAKWFQKSSEQGNAEAQYWFGNALFFGVGVAKNKSEGFKWFHKSAEQGNADAQVMCFSIYYKGDGVPKDLIEAYKWVNLASTTNQEAMEIRDKLETSLTSEQIAEGQRLTREWQATHSSH